MKKNPIREYVDKGLQHGYSFEHLQRELRKAGHSDSEIVLALGDTKSKNNHFDKMLVGATFVLIVLLMFFLSAISDQSLFNIFLGFLPTVLSITIAVIVLEMYRESSAYIWIVPLVFIAIFYFWSQETLLAMALDIPQITVMNVIVSYIFIMIIQFIAPPKLHQVVYVPVIKEVPKIVVKEVPREVIKEVIKEVPVMPELREVVQALEDKCKAINHVIGRVYKQKNGGIKIMREKIRIPREWYNTFTQIKEGAFPEKEESLRPIIVKVVNRLNLLRQTEKDVFGHDYTKLKKLNRLPSGNSKIIEVLKNNDDDPIEVYVASAIEVCEKVLRGK
ncbi:hypothetical protein J4457_02940 [Candidatus Woesearchaeota archaeon]|nr:hypothetical protein [Candidatus Woesearchaeota archaeon]